MLGKEKVEGVQGSKDLEADHIGKSFPQMKNWGTFEGKLE